ncbi:MAG: CarD family transcriptional regulator [Lachnospiraceae bacterium]|nr:CarD family transcriptional regulator [Lachnospiraceae bacterium]
MFEVGDYVVYGNNGVCVVDEITHMEMKGVDNHKLYYRLKPVDNRGSKIFTPVDNTKVVIRRMITKKEAEELIDALPAMEPVWVPNDKQREEIYKDVVRSCDPSQWFRIILTLYNRKQERIAQGRKITSMDERYFKQVENCLYSELSLALDCNRDEVIGIIRQRVGE